MIDKTLSDQSPNLLKIYRVWVRISLYKRLRSTLNLCIVVIVIVCASATHVSAETFQEYLAYFYQTNPTLLASDQDLAAQNEAYVQAREAFGPSVSVQFQRMGQVARVGETDIFGNQYTQQYIGWTSQAQLQISQPIYTGGRLTAQVTAAEADIFAARDGARVTVGQTFRDAIKAYLDVVRDEAIFNDAGAARSLLERDLADTQEKFKAGVAALGDRAQIVARLALARVQVVAAESQLAQSRAAFLSVIGQEPNALEPAPNLRSLPQSREAAVATALVENAALRQAIFQEVSARAKIAFAKSAFSAQVSWQVSAQSAPLEPYVSTQKDNNVSASLLVEVPLFVSGANVSALRGAEDSDRSACLKIEAIRRTVTQTAEQAFFAADAARRSVTLLVEQVHADQVAFDALHEQFRSGLLSTIDLLNSEQELANSKITLDTANHDVVLAEADLLNAVGHLEPDILVPNIKPRRPEEAFRKLHIISAGLPTTLLVREIDSVGQEIRLRPEPITQEPLEQSPLRSLSEGPLGDMDPSDLGGSPQVAPK